MNNTPTPQTDDFCNGLQSNCLETTQGAVDLANFARQLERDLNEADNTSRTMVRLHDEQEKEIEQLCEERDQLRKVLDQFAIPYDLEGKTK